MWSTLELVIALPAYREADPGRGCSGFTGGVLELGAGRGPDRFEAGQRRTSPLELTATARRLDFRHRREQRLRADHQRVVATAVRGLDGVRRPAGIQCPLDLRDL